MLSAKYGFLIKFFINRKVQGVFVHATLHSCKPGGIAACPQFLTEKHENAKCFPEFPEKLD